MLEVSATLDEFMKDQLGGFHYPAGCDPTMDKCLWWTDSAPKGVVDYAPRGVSNATMMLLLRNWCNSGLSSVVWAAHMAYTYTRTCMQLQD